MEHQEAMQEGIRFLMIKTWEMIYLLKDLIKKGVSKMWYAIKKKFDIVVLTIMSILMMLKMVSMS